MVRVPRAAFTDQGKTLLCDDGVRWLTESYGDPVEVSPAFVQAAERTFRGVVFPAILERHVPTAKRRVHDEAVATAKARFRDDKRVADAELLRAGDTAAYDAACESAWRTYRAKRYAIAADAFR